VSPATNITWHEGDVTRDDRAALMGGHGATLWFTGLSGSGKSTLAVAVEQQLVASGRVAYRLDGDNLRTGINSDLGFSREERLENCRRVAEVARLFADAGLIAIVAVISPYAESRVLAKRIHREAGLPFVEIFMATSPEECAARDPKGLYAQSAAGTLGSFTGMDDPYEVPEDPDLAIEPTVTVAEAVDLVVARLAVAGG
jgi:adenylylsulfate kinase